MNNYWKSILYILLYIIMIPLIGYIIMLLWNWLMPIIFNLPIITFWQAVGLDILISLLFTNPNININNK